MLELLECLCFYCHLLPQMKASPAHFCTACHLALRKKALSDRMEGILADRGRRDAYWRIEADWAADSSYGPA